MHELFPFLIFSPFIQSDPGNMDATVSHHEVRVIQGRGTREKGLGLRPGGMLPPAGTLHQDIHVTESIITLFKSLSFWDFYHS